MNKLSKLSDGQKHLLKLAYREAGPDGWAAVSKAVFQLIEKMPTEMVELEMVGDDGRGRVRLTDEGNSVITALAWM